MTPLVLPFPGNEALSRALVEQAHWPTGRLETREFPDGETYLRIDAPCAGQSVAVIATLDRPDRKLAPLLFAADTLRELGALHVGLVAPYLAYMRQDRRFQAGEAITSRIFAALVSSRFDWLVTVDPHLHRFRSLDELYTIPTRVVHAAPAIASWIASNVAQPLLIGPDIESEQWVADVAKRANAPHVVLSKVRRGDRDVEVSVPDVEQHRDRTPVVVDDIVASARTMIQAVRQLVAVGLPNPVCVGVHGIFAGDAYRALQEAGAAQIVTTRTVAHPSNAIDIADLLVPALVALTA